MRGSPLQRERQMEKPINRQREQQTKKERGGAGMASAAPTPPPPPSPAPLRSSLHESRSIFGSSRDHGSELAMQVPACTLPSLSYTHTHTHTHTHNTTHTHSHHATHTHTRTHTHTVLEFLVPKLYFLFLFFL